MQPADSPSWFDYLSDWQLNLVQTAYKLLSDAKTKPKPSQPRINSLPLNAANFQIDDYSYILFPMAKAYEGFLKKFLFDLHLISEEVYLGKKFRIGRAMNPDVYPKHRDKWWLYDDLARLCGETMARSWWETWLTCRNRVFHYFPRAENKLDLFAVEARLQQVATAMKQAVEYIRTH